jgi:hypothetical protein
MSAFLVFHFLIGTAAIVWSVCFVGCNLTHAGPPPPVTRFDQYQNTVTSTPGLVAFWPLDETDTSSTIAADLGPYHFRGTYTRGPVRTYSAAEQSDASPGSYTFSEGNIVAGDGVSIGGRPAVPNQCVYFNGGYVSVPYYPELGPLTPRHFTLEAWVVPNWDDAETHPSYRAVVASAASMSGTFSGFSLLANPDNLWAAAIGIGSQDVFATTGNNQTIVQGSLYFLVVTYDGSTLTLWVNPADTSQPPDATAAAGGYVPVPSPVPFYIGTGGPALPTPLFPFNGRIQDVAFYNVVLDNQTIETHYMNGLGMQM